MPPWLPLLLIAVLAALLWYKYKQDHTVYDGKYYRLPSGLYERCRFDTFVHNVDDCFDAEPVSKEAKVRVGDNLEVVIEFTITPLGRCLLYNKSIAAENTRLFLLGFINEEAEKEPLGITDKTRPTALKRIAERAISAANITATLSGFKFEETNLEVISQSQPFR